MDGAPATEQTCYRHPGREANVRCTRCERPVCPECMVSASVGFQCPACVADGHQGVREARSAFGGRLTSNTALVTKILIGLNLAVFLLVTALGSRLVDELDMFGHAMLDGELAGVATGPGQWYRLLTAVFLHQAVLHLGLNMLSLWWLGPPLEAALGRWRFIALYILSGLGGSALSFLLAAPNQPSLGASGAIFGLFGAIAVLVKKVGGDMKPLGVILALNLVFTFLGPNIDWRAHVGGLVFGALIAFGMIHAPRGNRTRYQVLTCVGAFALIVVLVWMGTVRITG